MHSWERGLIRRGSVDWIKFNIAMLPHVNQVDAASTVGSVFVRVKMNWYAAVLCGFLHRITEKRIKNILRNGVPSEIKSEFLVEFWDIRSVSLIVANFAIGAAAFLTWMDGSWVAAVGMGAIITGAVVRGEWW